MNQSKASGFITRAHGIKSVKIESFGAAGEGAPGPIGQIPGGDRGAHAQAHGPKPGLELPENEAIRKSIARRSREIEPRAMGYGIQSHWRGVLWVRREAPVLNDARHFPVIRIAIARERAG